VEHRGLLAFGQLHKCIPRRLRLPTVAQNDLLEINAAAVMAIRGCRSGSVATLPVMGIPLCSSTNSEAWRGWNDEL